ncbi:HAD family hydrolase [Streptomyces sp. NPDC060194]|uniref:HAD family hydrolase n=1 Tax=Streptomyces sp. NPDC060194 TaxID=3347069 RepID=UPI00364CAA66
MPIRAVLWDVDDTIFDYTTADRVGMRAQLEAEGLLDRFDTVEQALGVWRETTERHWARFAEGGIGFEEQRRDRVRDFLGRPLTDAEADAWFHRYLVHYEAAWALFDDVLPALDALVPAYRHAVLSNSSARHQERKLTRLGVRDRFEALLCAAELGVSKPSPEAFLAACEEIGLPPAEVAYVGDHPEIDARGACAVGLRGIWLDRTGVHRADGLARITGLAQLPALLGPNSRFGALTSFG